MAKWSQQILIFAVTLVERIKNYFFFFSLCDSALPATLFEASLYLPSLSIFDALEAILGEVTLFAIFPPFSFYGNIFQVAVLQ